MASDGIRLFRTAPHKCGYYDDRLSVNQVLDPQSPALAGIFGQALAHGFRRAGDIVYRPDCGACSACTPYRVVVADFVASRAQRRVQARNRDIAMYWLPAAASAEHFALYRRYLKARHADGGMDEPTPEDYQRFLLSRWAQTWFLEMRLDGELVGCAVTDLCDDAASAIYTYFDPDRRARSLGTLAILEQIAFCRERRLAHLYLGFWIDGHPKMHYKRQFGPGEVRVGGRWIRSPEVPAPAMPEGAGRVQAD